MNLSEVLKIERSRRNLKQSDIAKELGLSVQVWSSYETGLREPKLNTLIMIADFFDMPLDRLVGRSYLEQKLDYGNYEENYLLDMFRALSGDDKEKVIAITKTLHDMDKKSSGEKQTG